jgi:uncharacterized membrane protein
MRLIIIRDLVVKGKFYLNRFSSYFAIVNFVLLLLNLYDEWTFTTKVFMVVLSLSLIIFFGWLEVHVIKSYKKENEYIHDNTPVHPLITEINDRLKRLEQRT